MATMYPLFFGLLLIAVCGILGTGNGAVGAKNLSTLRNIDTRARIIHIAAAEIGTREATGNNDGDRVGEYLQYAGLASGHAWCAAFASWCYGQAGLSQPRNPWSPALFPNARTYWRGGRLGNGERGGIGMRINPADIFGIYGTAVKRINHVGLVKGVQGQYLITIEGNSNDKVESRRRHLSTIYALTDWIGDN